MNGSLLNDFIFQLIFFESSFFKSHNLFLKYYSDIMEKI